MTRAVIFDIDGTLADIAHRLHFITNGRRDWGGFFAALPDDGVKLPIRELLYLVADAGITVVLVTGRPERCREATEAWLEKHSIMFSEMHMRPDGDSRADYVVKSQILDGILADGLDILFTVDDRPTVVKMWRERGLTCLQVADWENRGGAKAPSLLTLMVGPSGGGKTSWLASDAAREYGIHPSHVLGSDQIRADLCGDFRDQSRNDAALCSCLSRWPLRAARAVALIGIVSILMLPSASRGEICPGDAFSSVSMAEFRQARFAETVEIFNDAPNIKSTSTLILPVAILEAGNIIGARLSGFVFIDEVVRPGHIGMGSEYIGAVDGANGLEIFLPSVVEDSSVYLPPHFYCRHIAGVLDVDSRNWIGSGESLYPQGLDGDEGALHSSRVRSLFLNESGLLAGNLTELIGGAPEGEREGGHSDGSNRTDPGRQVRRIVRDKRQDARVWRGAAFVMGFAGGAGLLGFLFLLDAAGKRDERSKPRHKPDN